MSSHKRRLFGPLLWLVLAIGVLEVIGLKLWSWYPEWVIQQKNKQVMASMRAQTLAALGSSDPLARAHAASWFKGRGRERETSDVVLSALDDADPNVRASAASVAAFTLVDTDLALERLINLLDDKAPHVRVAAARALGEARTRVRDADPQLWRRAISGLDGILKDSDPQTSEAAALALLEFHEDDPTVLEAVNPLLLDPASACRFRVALAILSRASNQPRALECLWQLAVQNEPDLYRAGAVYEIYRLAPQRRGDLVSALMRLIVYSSSAVRREAIHNLWYLASFAGRNKFDTQPMERAIPLLWVVGLFGAAQDSLDATEAIYFIERRTFRLTSLLLLRHLFDDTLPPLDRARLLSRLKQQFGAWLSFESLDAIMSRVRP